MIPYRLRWVLWYLYNTGVGFFGLLRFILVVNEGGHLGCEMLTYKRTGTWYQLLLYQC